MSAADQTPLINPNPTLQKYYASLESRIGYRLFLGNTRHFGYYEKPTSSPVPVGKALRAMEHELFTALQLPRGARVLDAGCGVGHVAIYMAATGGFQVDAIDLVAHHVDKARRNVRSAGLASRIAVRVGDYHRLEDVADNTYDGIYTMETFVHATDPRGVLEEFRRILKPGGRLAMNEYDHVDLDKGPKDLAESMKTINTYAAMPGNAAFSQDLLKQLVQEAGFQDVGLRDMSPHVVPLLWFFYVFAVVPLFLIRLVGLEHRFVNTLAAVESYRGRKLWRYIQVTGHK